MRGGIFVCDRCGTREESFSIPPSWCEVGVVGGLGSKKDARTKTSDLCTSCSNQLQRWLKPAEAGADMQGKDDGALAEREECAKLADVRAQNEREQSRAMWGEGECGGAHDDCADTAEEIAAAIRARGREAGRGR